MIFVKMGGGLYNYIQIKYPVNFNTEFAVYVHTHLYDRHKDISHLAAFSYIGHFSKLLKYEAPEPFWTWRWVENHKCHWKDLSLSWQ